jgi:hypothetical protein
MFHVMKEALQAGQGAQAQAVAETKKAAVPAPIPAPKKVVPAKREPHAVFVKDINLPDGEVVEPSSFLIKSWKLRNAGQEAWPVDTKVIFLRGDRLLPDGIEEFSLGADKGVQPGEEVVVSVPLQLPGQAGKVTSHFQLANSDRTVFGPRFWAELRVGPVAVAEAKQLQVPAVPVAATSTTSASTTASGSPAALDILAPMRAAAAATAVAVVVDSEEEDSEDGRVEDVDEDSEGDYQLVDPVSQPLSRVSDCPPVVAGGGGGGAAQGLGESKHPKKVACPAPAPEEEAVPAPAATPAEEEVEAGEEEDEVVDEEMLELTKKYGSQLTALARMGFTNTLLNGYLLNKHNGNLESAITWLLRLDVSQSQ